MLAAAAKPLAAPHPDPGHAVDRSAPFLWYTLSVVPQSQARVCQRAKELGITTYVPMSRTPPVVRKFGRMPVVQAEVRPLMPGYVFVLLSAADPRFHLFHASAEPQEAIRGALRLLAGPNGPMAVSEAVVADMKAREAAGEFDLTGLSENGRYIVPRWVARDVPVQFVDGPFRGLFGTIVKTIGKSLVRVAVTIFGRVSEVDAPMDWVRRTK